MAFADFASQLRGGSLAAECGWRPVLFTLRPAERTALDALAHDAHLRLTDTIVGQLDELARTRYPSPMRLDERREFIAHIRAEHGGTDAYGTWAYFAWSRTVVHLLPEDDYFAVITSRNHDKITLDFDPSVLYRKSSEAAE